MSNLMRKFAKRLNSFVNKPLPNTHMEAKDSVLNDLGGGYSCYLRPSFSDFARKSEFELNIYAPSNPFTQKVKDICPNVLIDIGSNIGLSSLSLSKTFPSLKTIVGVEAEKENFEILRMNYDLWQSKRNRADDALIQYVPVYAIASCVSGRRSENFISSRLSGGVSASGTFRFIPGQFEESPCGNSREDELETVNVEFSPDQVSVDEIFRNQVEDCEKSTAVVKVDIEGGEEELFMGECEWLSKTAFLTVEIHDVMGCPNSSRALLKRLSEHDFALLPENDVLHCYNREILGL